MSRRRFNDKNFLGVRGYLCSEYRSKSGYLKNDYKYAIRFNLSKGFLFGKWMLIDLSTKGDSAIAHFFEPSEMSFNIKNGLLSNKTKISKQIYKCQLKRVSSMIYTNSIEITEPQKSGDILLLFKPTLLPFWVYLIPGETINEGMDPDRYLNIKIDEQVFDMFTSGKNCFMV